MVGGLAFGGPDGVERSAFCGPDGVERSALCKPAGVETSAFLGTAAVEGSAFLGTAAVEGSSPVPGMEIAARATLVMGLVASSSSHLAPEVVGALKDIRPQRAPSRDKR